VTAALARLRPRAARPALRHVLAAAAALALLPASAGAWGFTGHRMVGRKAVRTLPDPLRRVFEANAAYLSEQAITPDLQRSGPSDPDHFLDMDAFGGAYPFETISHVESENIARFGRDDYPGRSTRSTAPSSRPFAIATRPACSRRRRPSAI